MQGDEGAGNGGRGGGVQCQYPRAAQCVLRGALLECGCNHLVSAGCVVVQQLPTRKSIGGGRGWGQYHYCLYAYYKGPNNRGTRYPISVLEYPNLCLRISREG